MDPDKFSFFEVMNSVFTSGQTTIEPRCYGYLFINKGDTGVRINGHYLKPFPPGRPELSGESYAFVDPLRSVVTLKQFQVVFDGAPMVTPWLEITMYLKTDQ